MGGLKRGYNPYFAITYSTFSEKSSRRLQNLFQRAADIAGAGLSPQHGLKFPEGFMRKSGSVEISMGLLFSMLLSAR
jgi:hypothetical protein